MGCNAYRKSKPNLFSLLKERGAMQVRLGQGIKSSRVSKYTAAHTHTLTYVYVHTVIYRLLF